MSLQTEEEAREDSFLWLLSLSQIASIPKNQTPAQRPCADCGCLMPSETAKQKKYCNDECKDNAAIKGLKERNLKKKVERATKVVSYKKEK